MQGNWCVEPLAETLHLTQTCYVSSFMFDFSTFLLVHMRNPYVLSYIHSLSLVRLLAVLLLACACQYSYMRFLRACWYTFMHALLLCIQMHNYGLCIHSRIHASDILCDFSISNTSSNVTHIYAHMLLTVRASDISCDLSISSTSS